MPADRPLPEAADRSASPPLVAVINTSEENLDMLCTVMESEGYATVRAYVVDFKRGRQDIQAFFNTHRPDAVLFDIALPYIENWRYFQNHILAAQLIPTYKFILTTTNKQILELLVGQTATIELIGKPHDLDVLCASVANVLVRTR